MTRDEIIQSAEWELNNRGMSTNNDALKWSVTPSAPAEEDRERRKLRNEDSSYDSDFDQDASSPRHEDVSRTVSETLAAEFDEYVTLEPKRQQPSMRKSCSFPLGFQAVPSTVATTTTPTVTSTTSLYTSSAQPSDSATTIASIVASPEYSQWVDFAVKLGYSENLVQLALTKLGANPDKNKLLDELIRLGAGAPKADSENDEPEADQIREEPEISNLRPIVIDGSNVAMSHGNQQTFSCKGIKIVIEWFQARGHKEILAFAPKFRKEASKVDATISDREILFELEREGLLCFTPSRTFDGKRIVAYDDRYMLKEATNGGILVSNDNYRDLINEKEAYRKVVEESLLMYSWVKGRFEPPEDPMGRNGPSLDTFLRRTNSKNVVKDAKTCPYLKKCTYGNKCKYTHPERGTAPVKSVTERLQEHAQRHYQEKEKAISRDPSPGDSLRAKTLSLPGTSETHSSDKRPISRTLSINPAITSYALREEMANYQQNLIPPVPPRGFDAAVGTQKYTSQVPQNPTWTWSPQELPSDLDAQASKNQHLKLQRQLSINPVHDARLSNKFLIDEHPHPYMQSKFMGNVSEKDTQLRSDQLPVHPDINPQVRPDQMIPHILSDQRVYRAPTRELVSQIHTPVTRHSSTQDAKLPSYLLPNYMHNHVTRNLSAPDAVWGNRQPQSNYHSRLNSTSDSHLNLHTGEHVLSDPFDEPIYPAHVPSPGPVGSRPISPQVQQIMQQRIPPVRIPANKPYEDERFKIFYHLSQLFPEGVVRQALRNHPQETDPKKICASILNIHPNNLPPQFCYAQGQAYRGFTTPVETSKEALRGEAYRCLSRLFLEDQVLKVMAAYPDETDPTQLCMLLVGLNNPNN